MSNLLSFRKAVTDLQKNLYSFALKLTLNSDDAHDLLQDTTLKAFDSQDKFVEDANLKGWLLTIMRNIFINNYRQESRRNTVIDTSEDLFHINLCQESGIDSPDSMYTVNEISALLKQFPMEYSEPFNMHVAGYKYEEIADVLDLPLSTVKSRIFFMRKKLRTLLKDYR